jgi:hypothetical protein
MSWSIGRRTRRPSLSAPQARRPPTTESDMGRGGGAAASGASPAGAFACNHGSQFIEGKPAGAQGRPRPGHRRRRASTAGSASGNRYREQRTVVGTAPAVSREAVSERRESLVCVVAAETYLRRRNARLPGIICRRLQITAVLVDLALCSDQGGRRSGLDVLRHLRGAIPAECPGELCARPDADGQDREAIPGGQVEGLAGAERHGLGLGLSGLLLAEAGVQLVQAVLCAGCG